jgi:hypothetical protein
MIYGWRGMLVLLAPAFVVLARRAVDPGRRATAAWFVLGATFLPMVVTAELVWKFSESRYFFHLYPLMLVALAVLAVAAADAVLRRMAGPQAAPDEVGPGVVAGGGAGTWKLRSAVVTLLCTAVVMVLADDTNGADAWRVSSREHSSPRDPLRAVLNFRWHADFHQDLKTASLRAAEQIRPQDIVVVVGPPHQAVTYRQYLGRIDYIATSVDPYLTLSRQADGF